LISLCVRSGEFVANVIFDKSFAETVFFTHFQDIFSVFYQSDAMSANQSLRDISSLSPLFYLHSFFMRPQTFLSTALCAVACVAFSCACFVSCAQRESAKSMPEQQPAQEAVIGMETSNKAASVKVFALESVEVSKSGQRADFAWKDGKSVVKLSDFSKGKPVFLNFWATWCPPCRRELPDIVELNKEFGDKVVFIGVALENESKAAKAAPLVSSFAQKNNLGYINLVGDDKVIAEITAGYGNVEAIPTTFVIGKDGAIVQKLVGGQSKQDFLAAIKKAL
jgi:thiol-disulfide isomerase/thioredoxin